MTSPQPVHKASNTKAILIVGTIVVVLLCLVLAACLIPFGLFAWIADRQMDWSEENTPQMHLARTLLARFA